MQMGSSQSMGTALIILGVILLLIVFYAGYTTYKSYQLQTQITEENAAKLLGISAEVLINLLVKIAFLGIALAAGAIILGKGVDLMKGCPSKQQ